MIGSILGALPIPGAKQGGKYLTKGTIELEEQLEKSLVSAGTSKYRLPMDLQLFAGRGKGIPKVVNGFDATIHAGKQGKHIPGHSNYQYGKSILTANAQKLLEKYAGKGEWIGQNKERVDFGEIIGKYVDPITGEAIETNKGIIHYSKNGAHIVPARP